MGGTSKSVVLFVRAEPVVNTQRKYAEDHQSSMENGTLKVEPVSFYHTVICYAHNSACNNQHSVGCFSR